jgi:hypothetical protein
MCGESLRIVDDSGCVAEEAVLMGGFLAFTELNTGSAASSADQPTTRRLTRAAVSAISAA